MEHPLRVDEFDPSETPPSVGVEPAVAAPPAAASAPLPAAAESALKRRAVAETVGCALCRLSARRQQPHAAQPVAARGVQDRTRGRRHGRLGPHQQFEICGPLRRPFLRRLFSIGRCRDRCPWPEHDFGRQDRGSGHGRLGRFAVPPLSGAGRPGSGAAGRKLSDRRHLRAPDGRRPRAAGAVAWANLRQPSASHRHRQPGPDIAGERHLRA